MLKFRHPNILHTHAMSGFLPSEQVDFCPLAYVDTYVTLAQVSATFPADVVLTNIHITRLLHFLMSVSPFHPHHQAVNVQRQFLTVPYTHSNLTAWPCYLNEFHYTGHTQKNGAVSKVNTKLTLHCNHGSGHLKTEHTESLFLL
jgi:hypothetical protein